ncbi:MAG: ATP-dependent DNA helicase, partial [Candidatus Methanomethylophilaceae archaeon]|nr:ATP-dependent DNA helicase [Candidatus Methanomethylophilaceae archaeon]
MDIFPYGYRPGQKELVDFISSTVSEGGIGVIEAGTGTGKTVSSLSGSLPHVLGTDRKLIYLTRTKSQQKQVVEEASALKVPVLCIALQGRSAQSCPMMRDDPDLSTGTSEEISGLCSAFKRKGPDGHSACPYFDTISTVDLDAWAREVREVHPDPEEFRSMCEAEGLCPYEFSKLLLPKADVISVPYPFVFSPVIFSRFKDWVGISEERMSLVVDEAHNLPDYLRDLLTAELSSYGLEHAEKEALEYGDSGLFDGISVSDVTSVLREMLGIAIREYLIDDDGLLPPDFLQEQMLYRLGITSGTLENLLRTMIDMGEQIAESKKSKKKLPRSYVRSLGNFLRFWLTSDDRYYITMILGGDNPRFQVYCMDPSLAAGPLRNCRSSICMSGTLAPLDAYIRELGLDGAVAFTSATSFSKDNMLTLYSGGVSMKYEERFEERNYRELLSEIKTCVGAVRV